MKKAEKVWLITAGFLILIGFLVFFGVMASYHWDITALDNTEYETNTVTIQEDFQNISVCSDTETINFFPSDDGSCRVVFYEKKQVQPTACVQDGTLSIGTVDTREWYDFLIHFTLSLRSPGIAVYLPATEYASLAIKESTGDISIPKDFTFETMDISAGTGDVYCGASESGEMRISTSTGDIRLANVSAGELHLSVSTGKTALTDVSCRNIHSTGGTGDIAMENVVAEEMISIKRSTGDVRFERCDAASLEIETDTGDVTGSFSSEKVFIARSDTGTISVPKTVSGGKCSITTDTGDIIITLS
ncbi:MAG: DUF4097 family beta strand repeat protein [Oscillospiraceae bacterium]|nr:DUF4097 family beta strand repeat protein [Oscillospiraceae bacterium]